MFGKKSIVSLLLVSFLVAQFLSIGNALNLISAADYDDIEDLYDIEAIVTLDPFLASSPDAKEELIKSAIHAVFEHARIFYSVRKSLPPPSYCRLQHLTVSDRFCARLWLKNRSILS